MALRRAPEIHEQRLLNHSDANRNPRINSLPFEIISGIFGLCQPPRLEIIPAWIETRTSDKVAYSWLVRGLACVCQRWRTVSVNSPALWQTIIIDEPFRFAGSFATTFLDRAYPLPIDLYHTTSMRYEKETRRYKAYSSLAGAEAILLCKFYQNIASNPERIKSLFLKEASPSSAWSLLKHSMSNLENIQVSVPRHETFDFDLRTAPNIRRISLDNYLWINYPPPHLTHAYFSNEGFYTVEYGEFLHFLRSTSATIAVLVLDEAGPYVNKENLDDHEVTSEESIHFPRMEHLEILESAPINSVLLEAIDEETFPLRFLHSLILPTTTKIIWSIYLSRNLGGHPDSDETDDENSDSEEGDSDEDSDSDRNEVAGSNDNRSDNYDIYRLPSFEILQRVTQFEVLHYSTKWVFELEGSKLSVSNGRKKNMLSALISRHLPNYVDTSSVEESGENDADSDDDGEMIDNVDVEIADCGDDGEMVGKEEDEEF